MPKKRQVRTVAKSLGVDSSALIPALVAEDLVKADAKETAQVDEAAARECWERFQQAAAANNADGAADTQLPNNQPPGDQAQADAGSPAEGEQSGSSAAPIVTAQDLVDEFVGKGLNILTLGRLAEIAPYLKRRGAISPDCEIRPETSEKLRKLLLALTVVHVQLEKDKLALVEWQMPDIDALLAQGQLFTYLGICGHEVLLPKEEYKKRYEFWKENNDQLTVLPRLCDACRRTRVVILVMIPDTANAESVCTFCLHSTFGGDNPAEALVDSRGEIWENLISDVLDIWFLPERLGTDHGARHRLHVRLLAQRGREFDTWEERYRLEISALVSKHPDKGEKLKQQMPKVIRKERIKLGLESPEGRNK